MKLTKKIILALGTLAAVSASFAQTTATPAVSAPTGLLGTQYTELSFGLSDIKHSSDHLYSVGAGANTALIPGKLDGGGFYEYSWIKGEGHANTVGGLVTGYTALGRVKPFLSAALGYQWIDTRFGSENLGIWGLSTGVEIPAGVVTITPRISYADDFKDSRPSAREWTYSVEANYWFNAKMAVFGSVGRSDIRNADNTWNYVIGLRSKF